MAGGDYAVRFSDELAEDDPKLGADAVRGVTPTINDCFIGIAASGRTPFVLGGLQAAQDLGCYTAGIACSTGTQMTGNGLCQDTVECVVGPESVTGSTRMKAGTAQKLVNPSFTTS